ncbi:MAG: hypothetical protein KIT87_18700 [Anaerolineae bacterium]|nr:hypothetical protein [Anaerolineae bacterium]
MNNHIVLRLALITFAIVAIFGISRGATAIESQQTPRSYLPLVSNAPAAVAWDIGGNAGTNPLLNFLGTTDGKSLIIQPGSGNVGIGTTAPNQKLSVQTATGRSGVAHTDGNVIVSTSIFTNTGRIGTLTNHPLTLFTNRSPTGLTLTTNNEVVLASTVAPQGKLTIQTDRQDQSAITLFDPTEESLQIGVNSRFAFLAASQPLLFAAGNGSVLLTSDGKVGIGTDTPSARLTVRTTQDGQHGIRQTDGTVNLTTFINSGRGYLGTDSNHPLTLLSGGRTVMNLGTDGRIGIGTQPDTAAMLMAQGTDGLVGVGTTGVGVGGVATTGIGVLARTTTGPSLLLQTGSGDFAWGISSDARRFHITNDGTYVTGSDFAEALPARSIKDSYSPGDVLVLSTDAPGGVERASEPYDVRVAGVYSTRPGVLGADKDGETRVDIGDVPVALVGVVPTKVSAENGPIQVGDQLTTSATPGHAMRCADRARCLGAIIGKAMEPLKEGTGTIKVLVTLR